MKKLPKGTKVTVGQISSLFEKYHGVEGKVAGTEDGEPILGESGETMRIDMPDGGAVFLKEDQFKEVA